ncbi:uncharacterized protein METZ01_LOCUS367256, partial [marine metagenome]
VAAHAPKEVLSLGTVILNQVLRCSWKTAQLKEDLRL